MLFIRKGPRVLFIRCAAKDRIADILRSRYGGRTVSFEQGIARAGEGQSLICVTPEGLTRTRIGDAEEILAVPYEEAQIVADLFSSELKDAVEKVQLGPGMILLRVAGTAEGLTEDLRRRYSLQALPLEEAISEGEVDDTVLLLTAEPLSKIVDTRRLVTEPLLMHHPSAELYWQLRAQGVHLITKNLAKKEWYEVRINIYDAADHYEEHYERLMQVISDLDIGLVLAETWTKDHALALFSVLAYQLRLFTLEPPEKIKRLLMALEYNESGKRFVDMDLYYRNRKINKNDKGVRLAKSETYPELRRDLYDRLSPEALRELRDLEQKILEE